MKWKWKYKSKSGDIFAHSRDDALLELSKELWFEGVLKTASPSDLNKLIERGEVNVTQVL